MILSIWDVEVINQIEKPLTKEETMASGKIVSIPTVN